MWTNVKQIIKQSKVRISTVCSNQEALHLTSGTKVTIFINFWAFKRIQRAFQLWEQQQKQKGISVTLVARKISFIAHRFRKLLICFLWLLLGDESEDYCWSAEGAVDTSIKRLVFIDNDFSTQVINLIQIIYDLE